MRNGVDDWGIHESDFFVQKLLEVDKFVQKPMCLCGLKANLFERVVLDNFEGTNACHENTSGATTPASMFSPKFPGAHINFWFWPKQAVWPLSRNPISKKQPYKFQYKVSSLGDFFCERVEVVSIGNYKATPLKTNGWNLKIPPWKRRNIDPNHQFLGSMFALGSVYNLVIYLLR